MAAKFDFAQMDKPFEADWPVEVRVPKDGGDFETQTFMARFRQIPTAEIAKAAEEATDALAAQKIVARLGFIGLGAGEGELTDALKEKLLDRVNVRLGIEKAYVAFNTGVAAKN